MKASTRNTPDAFGRYSVQRELAAGGMASVFVARDPVLLRPVAIKVLHDKLSVHATYVQRFFQEARTVAQLQSPNIVEVHDFGEEAGKHFLVMEFVDGLSLQGVLDSLMPERMDPVVAAALVCQAAEGLLAASRRGVVHRDIKPANLLISPQGYLKVADFGISHLKDQTQTRTGAIVGSACYMSPEQATGEKGITIQSDMFSLGTVFYRCLSGSDPFYTETYAGTLRMIIDGHQEPLHRLVPDLDPEILRLVELLLQKDPTKRGGGPAWLKAQLREYLLKKRIADPVERIRQFLDELSGRGIQTTGFVSPIQIASAEFALAPRGGKSGNAPKGSWALKGFLVAIVGLALAAGWIWWRALLTPAPPSQQTAAPAPTLAGTSTPIPVPPKDTVSSVSQALTSPLPAASRPEPRGPRKTRERRHLGLGAGAGLPARTGSGEGAVAPEKAFLSLTSAPPFVDVVLDGKPAGTTPLTRLPLTPGRHRLVLEATQINSILDTTIYLSAGEQSFKLRLPGKAAE